MAAPEPWLHRTVGFPSNDEMERLAAEVRRIARLQDGEVALAPRIALAVLGKGAIRRASRLQSEACLTIIDGRYRIVMREIGRDSNFAIAHELGHWALRVLGNYGGPEEERAANFVGAAILAPPPPWAAARRYYPADGWDPIARTFGVSQTCAGLRAHDVEGIPIAILTVNGNEIVRGTDDFTWKTVDIKAAALVARPRGLKKTELRGGIDEGRIIFRPTNSRRRAAV